MNFNELKIGKIVKINDLEWSKDTWVHVKLTEDYYPYAVELGCDVLYLPKSLKEYSIESVLDSDLIEEITDEDKVKLL